MLRQSYRNSGFSKGDIINLDPTKPDSIYTALPATDREMKQFKGEEPMQNMGTAVIFNQPLYAKAGDIDESSIAFLSDFTLSCHICA